MSQQDGPINVDAFNLDAETMGGQTIRAASTPGATRDFQHTINQTTASGLPFLSPPQFSVPPPENTRLEYHPAFGYYPLNPPPTPTRQPFLNQTPNASAPTSYLLPSPNSAYALPPMVLSSPSPTSTSAPATIPAHIPIQTISLGVSAGAPITRSRRGGRGGRSSCGSREADRGGRNATSRDPASTTGMKGDADTKGSDEEQPTRKRDRNRNMTAREKLVLIRECCEHIDKY